MNRLLAIILLCGVSQELHAQVNRVLPPQPGTLRSGAVLDIRLEGVPLEDAEQLSSQPHTVANDGTIALPYIGPVMVTGLTLSQAERAIERAYIAGKIYRHPTIIILHRPSSPAPAHPLQRIEQRIDAPGPGYREHIKLRDIAISQ